MKYLFKNAMVLTMNNTETLKSCDVLVENGVISAIGSLNNEQIQKARLIDASGKLLMPGLINGHCHVPMTLL